MMPVQYIRQHRNRWVSRNVSRHLREFVAQGQAQLKFQIIAHSVVVLYQAACLALPRVLAAKVYFVTNYCDETGGLSSHATTLGPNSSQSSSGGTRGLVILRLLSGRPFIQSVAF